MKIKSKLFWRCWHTMWALLLTLMPTELFLILRAIASPEGFWQEIVLGVIGVFFLGSLQVLFVILYVMFLGMVWSDAETT